MCLNPTSIKKKKLNVQTGRFEDEWQLVPCGKCLDCVKDRQNDIAVMCYRAADQYGSMEFVTLTYNNESIPMYGRVYDEETGEVVGEPFRLTDNMEKKAREVYFSLNKDCLKTLAYSVGEGVEENFTLDIAPSLDRTDVRLWIKRARMQYQRHFGKKLPEFQYIVCGEYGPRTGRPHYHLGFFGLDHAQVDFMCRDWEKTHGFYKADSVIRFNPEDNSKSGYEAAAKYIGKYISKGKFEDEKVKVGAVEKPRKMASIHFGYGDDIDKLRAYHLCYDMFGEYDPNDLSRFTEADKERLCKEIIKRKKYSLNGKYYKLPRSITRQIFYRRFKETDITGEVKVVERASRLQKMVSQFIQNGFNQAFTEELGALKMQYNNNVPFEVVREVVHRIYHPDPQREKAVEKTIVRQYQRSVF